MPQLSTNLSLFYEALKNVRFVAVLLVKELQRDIAPEFLVVPFVDRAQAPTTKFSVQAVLA